MRKVIQAFVTFAVLFQSPITALAALDSGLSVGFKNEWTDNVGKTSSDRESGTISSLLLKANIAGDDSGYQYGIKYDVDYRSYSGGDFDSQSYLTGIMYLNFDLLPDRLRWENKLRSAVTERDSRLPSVPTNQDQRNTFTTMPILTLVNSKRDKVMLEASAIKTTYREQSQNDSDRIKADLIYSHGFNRLTAGGVTCGYASAEFETNTGYDSVTCKLTGQRKLKQGAFNIEVGQSQVEPDIGEDFEGLVYKLTLDLEQGYDRFYLFTSREVTDTVDGFYGSDFTRNNQTLQDTNTNLLSLTIRKRSEIGIERSFSSVTRASAFVFVADDDLNQSDEDTSREGAGITINRDISDTLSLYLYGVFQRVEFGGGSVEKFVDYTTNYFLMLNKDFSQHFRLAGWLKVEDRRARSSILTYEAHTIGASAVYTF